jgi:5'(3')-deoxyribonucleotidase
VESRFVLGVDLDGVLGDYLSEIRRIAAEWSGDNLLTPIVDYEFKKWGIDNWPGGYPALHKFAVTQRNMFSDMDPMMGAPQVLRELSAADVRIRIITSRLCIKYYHKEAVTQTVEWLENHGIPYWDLCFIKDKTAVVADLYIDDSEKNIIQLRDAGRNTLVFSNSTNANAPGPRVTNWYEVKDYVMGAINGSNPSGRKV